MSPRRLTLLFSGWTLLSLAWLPAVAAKCYWPNGEETSTDYEPTIFGSVSMCCSENDSAFNGICLHTNGTQVAYARNACSSKDWSTPGCLNLCPWVTNGPAPLTNCNDGSYCCGSSNSTCCDQKQGLTLKQLPAQVVNIQTVTVSPAATTTVTSSPTTDSYLPPPAEPRRSVALGAGLGLGLGIPILIAIAGILMCLRRRRAQQNRMAPRELQLPISRRSRRAPIPPPLALIKEPSSYASSFISEARPAPPIWPPQPFLKYHFTSISRAVRNTKSPRNADDGDVVHVISMTPREMPSTPKAFEVAMPPEDYLRELPARRFSEKSGILAPPGQPYDPLQGLPITPMPTYGHGLQVRTAGNGFVATKGREPNFNDMKGEGSSKSAPSEVMSATAAASISVPGSAIVSADTKVYPIPVEFPRPGQAGGPVELEGGRVYRGDESFFSD